MEFVLIRPGKFDMGSDDGGVDRKPVHRVTLTKAFYLGKYEVTQEQYQAVMGANPSEHKGGTNPVDSISWDDAQEFCRKLSGKIPLNLPAPARGEGKWAARLPTEAEWEYACRAGSATKYCFGDSAASLDEYAWYKDNSDSKTHPVGQKKPNAWGLYDLHGNVLEWCQDHYSGDYYGESPAVDPKGPANGTERVVRGGSWYSHSVRCGAASRDRGPPGGRGARVGFRCVVDF